MKKIISLIYRLSFIIFSLWGLFEYCGGNTKKLTNFVPLVDIICLICILAIFFISLKTSPSPIVLKIKGGCTLLAFTVILLSSDMLLAFSLKGWITAILLPVMMMLDWLFFDKKGSFSPKDLLSWLGALAAILAFLYLIGLKDLLIFFADPSVLLKLIAGLAAMALLMYILDALLGGGISKNSERFNTILFRVIFLILEGWCFVQISDYNMRKFLSSLEYYSVFVNFLCFLCIAVIVLISIFKHKNKGSSLPRIKGALATSALILPLFSAIYGHCVFNDTLVYILLCFICPLLMAADCIVFDSSSVYEPYDPFIWLSVPAVHFVAVYILLRPLGITNFLTTLPQNPLILFAFGIVAALALGYGFFFINKAKK